LKSEEVDMKKPRVLVMPRREFIASASFLVLGARLFGMSPLSLQSAQVTQELKEELTPEERRTGLAGQRVWRRIVP
jgi:hypothetical protein